MHFWGEGNSLAGAFRRRAGSEETHSSFATMASEPATKSLVPDGGLEKTILQPGDGEPAGKGALVSLRYSMRLQDAPADESFDSSENRRNGILRFRLGNRKVIPAVELIAESMAMGEECEVVCAPMYAFGEKGLKRKGVPPNATIFIRAEMVGLEGAVPKKVFEDMTPVERFSEAIEYKEKGNKLFKETKFEKAIAEYSKAIRFLAKVLKDPPAVPKTSVPATESKEEEVVEDGEEEDPSVESANGNTGTVTSSESSADVESKTAEAAAESVSEATPAADNPVEVAKDETDATADEDVPVIDVTADISGDAAGAPVFENDIVTNDEEGFQGAQVVDESANGVNTTEDNGEKETEAPKSDTLDSPTAVEVREMHVKTLNNLSLCCIKIGQYESAEQASTIAIQMDVLNSKAFYNRYVHRPSFSFSRIVSISILTVYFLLLFVSIVQWSCSSTAG